MLQREIVLDTETTGIDPADGHRIIEIGCIELINHLPTGVSWHEYINPEREVDAGAVAIHGIKTDFLKDKPVFAEIAGSFLDFIKDSRLIIHNAEFDIKFLNAELGKLGFPPLKLNETTDTLLLARKKFPGQPANLDALCRRFGIDLSARTYHGALLDSELLAEVYLELLGGRQHGLGLGNTANTTKTTGHAAQNSPIAKMTRITREPRVTSPSDLETELHNTMCKKIKDCLWENRS